MKAAPAPTPRVARDPTQVMWRRIVAYVIDALLVLLGMFTVLFVTGDVERVKNCNTIPSGRACFDYANRAVLVNQR